MRVTDRLLEREGELNSLGSFCVVLPPPEAKVWC